LKHCSDDFVPRFRVADKVGLQIVSESATLLRSGAVHKLASVYEPRWAHDHRLSALPVDFAFLNALMLEVIQQAAGQQWQKGQRKAMRFLAFEAVLASDVAVGCWKKNYAKYTAIHGVRLPIK
jgi:hypothetical protein